jgi:N-acetylglucosaminyl-diphospho-decaprenol L-rhamnosyltransferase
MAVVISFVVVNFNGKKFLKECLDSVFCNVSVPFEVILVDNASSDGSADFVASNYPNVKLIVSEKNLGFTGGNNLGARSATGDYLVLLNTDAILKSDVACLVDTFRGENSIGVIGCRLTYADDSFQPSFGYEHSPLRLILFWLGAGMMFKNLKIAMMSENREVFYQHRVDDIDWVSGAFLMVSRQIWMNLNGLDEDYFMYVEDVDFCRRVRMCGLLVSYDPAVLVVHYGGAGRPWIGVNAMKNTACSYLIHTRKFYSRQQVFFLRSALTAVFSFRAFCYFLFGIFRNKKIFQEKALGAFLFAKIMFFGRHT